jgi:predicted dehydrogenase
MSPSNRRQFLATAASGLGAVAQAQLPKGTIRTGILGIQHSHLMGKLQAMYDNPDYEVVAVCEPDEATRRIRGSQELLRRLPVVSMDEMLGDKSLDLVVFEGEVKDAVPFAKRVLSAGKHLHLEKPPANKLEPFRELVEMARTRNRRLQLGYLWRFHAGVDAVLDAYRQGWLGELLTIRATISSDRGPEQRAVEARYPGGSMFELGGHMIDRIIAFLGRPARVQHWLRHDTSIRDTLKDNTLAVFEYPSALALVVSSARVAGAEAQRSLEVIATDGSFLIQPMEPAPALRIHMRAARGPYKAGSQEIKLPPQPRFIRDFQELARAIKSGSELQYSYDHELLLQETLLRASGEMD